MKFIKNITFLVLFFLSSCSPFTNAATFNITNRCTYTVWAAASPGGGKRLNHGKSWRLHVDPGTVRARIWGRTKCKFDENGRGQCETGDCDGRLKCQGYGKAPNTLAEFSLNRPNNSDRIRISNVDGFNIPMEFRSVTRCRVIRCTAPIVKQCPAKLRAPGGCNNPCTVFPTSKYCCTNKNKSCRPTGLSRFFKERCPDAYSYPKDDRTSFFTCPTGTNYRVVFCP